MRGSIARITGGGIRRNHKYRNAKLAKLAAAHGSAGLAGRVRVPWQSSGTAPKRRSYSIMPRNIFRVSLRNWHGGCNK